MSQKFKSKIDAEQGIKITNELYDGSNAAGTSGQILSSTGSATEWIDANGDISGSGDANYVTKFTGAKTIGNGPITFSTNDSTFAGSVEIRSGNKLILQRPNNAVATEISTDSTGAMVLNSINSEGFFFNNNGNNIFKLDPVNATFAGDVLVEDNLYLTDAGTVRGKIQLNSSDRDDLDIKAVSLGSNMKFFTADTERARIDSSGNVGIGTGSPLVRLQLERTVSNATSRTAPVNLIYLTSEHPSVGYTGFGTAIAHYSKTYQNSTKTEQSKIAFTQQGDSASTAGSTIDFYTKTLSTGTAAPDLRMRINYNGNVGIGEPTPLGKLHIKKSDTSASANSVGNLLVLEDSENGMSILSSTSGAGYILFGDSDDDDIGGILYDHSANAMRFKTNGGWDRMRIDSDGSVRIGKNTNYAMSSPYLMIGNSANTNELILSNQGTTQLGGFDGSVVLSTGGSNNLLIGSDNGYTAFSYGVSNGYTSYNEAMRITSAGKIGIGTTTPDTLLHIYNPDTNWGAYSVITLGTDVEGTNQAQLKYYRGASTSTESFQLSVRGTTALTALYNGNVGIGTTSPAQKLDVVGKMKISDDIILAQTNGRLDYDNGNSSGALRFHSTSGNTERMRITSAGNVGIGTTSPGTKLHVVGANNTTAFKVDFPSADFDFSANSTSGYTTSFHMDNTGTYIGSNSAGRALIFQTNDTDRLYINGNTGNVGIGTTSPGLYPLSIHFNDSYGSYGPGKPVTITNETTTGQAGFLQLRARYNNTNNTFYQVGGMGGGKETALGDGGWGGYLSFWTTSDGSAGAASGMFEHMRITADGNVGIGTTTPNSALQVNQNSSAPIIVHRPNNTNFDPHGIGFSTRNDAANGGLGDVRSGIFSDYNGDLFLAAATSSITTSPLTYSRIFIEGGNGNVGIGTTSPSTKLHLGGTAPLDSIIRQDSTVSGTNWEIGERAAGKWQIWEDDADSVVATFMSTGNVGIGTTGPGAKLQVVNNSQSTSALTICNEVNGGDGFVFQKWQYVESTTNFRLDLKQRVTSGVVQYAFDMVNNGTGYTSVLVLDRGNVGIGTTSPASNLHVTGAPANGVYLSYLYNSGTHNSSHGLNVQTASSNIAAYGLRVNTGGDSNALAVMGNGKVGIGTNSPEFKLDVKSTSDTAPSAYLRGGKSSQGEIQNTGLIIGSQTTMVAGDYQGISFTGYTTSSAIRRGRAAIGVEAINGPGKMDLVFMTRFADDGTQLGAADEKMRITSAGNVGIGTSAPGHLLHVKKPSSGDAALMLETVTGGDPTIIFNSAATNRSGIIKFQDNGTNVGRIAYVHSSDRIDFQAGSATGATMSVANGKVGIGTDSPGYTLDVNGTAGFGSTTAEIFYGNGNANTYTLSALYMNQSNASNTDANGYFFERGRITNSSTAEIRRWVVGARGGQKQMMLDGPGSLTVAGDVVAYGSPSDKRLKENIKPIKSALDKVSKLQGVTFDWIQKEDQILDLKKDIGFIAQDVQKVIPELVRENENGMLSMRHQGITPILLEAIKELKAEIEELKSNKCNCNK